MSDLNELERVLTECATRIRAGLGLRIEAQLRLVPLLMHCPTLTRLAALGMRRAALAGGWDELQELDARLEPCRPGQPPDEQTKRDLAVLLDGCPTLAAVVKHWLETT
jgi:hypothetical protein